MQNHSLFQSSTMK